jgi:hypothetical protein
MFIGHFAVGFGTKAIQPRISLGMLFLSVQFLDLLWPTLLQLGLEKVEIRAESQLLILWTLYIILFLIA